MQKKDANTNCYTGSNTSCNPASVGRDNDSPQKENEEEKTEHSRPAPRPAALPEFAEKEDSGRHAMDRTTFLKRLGLDQALEDTGDDPFAPRLTMNLATFRKSLGLEQ